MEEARKRRRAQSNQSFPYIPEEIVVNILPNLPITSLLRFRCVSKQWCRLVTETKIQKRHKLLLVSKEDFSGRVPRELRYSRLPIGENPVLETLCRYHVDDSDWPDRLRSRWRSDSLSNPFFQFMGSCNGLLLIRQNTDLFLCNPTLGWYRKVTSHHHIGCGLFTYSGLFFDPGVNSYKALFAFTDTCRCDHCSGDFYVWVACFKTSTWTRILFPYYRHTIVSGPTLNNYVHWRSSSAVREARRRRSPHMIIRFDHFRNVFVELPMPKPKKEAGDYLVGLGVLDGCLCMARSDDGKLDYCEAADVEVLIMKEYGVKESWKSLFRVKNVNCYNLVPFFYAESKDEVLMGIRQGDNVAVAMYDTKTDTFTIVKELEHFDHIIAYEETLVRPPEFLME